MLWAPLSFLTQMIVVGMQNTEITLVQELLVKLGPLTVTYSLVLGPLYSLFAALFYRSGGKSNKNKTTATFI